MIIQNRDGSLTKEPGCPTNKRQGYYAVVLAYLLDGENTAIGELISFGELVCLAALSREVRGNRIE
jgi:hypothetical protein